jgi:hypothetical protein
MDPEPDALSGETALQPVRQQIVEFYDDAIPVALAPDGNFYVAVRPITEALGLNPTGQRNRINREPFLAEGTQTLRMLGADSRQRAMFCLRIDLLNAWLFGIDTSRVRDDLQDKITRYKRECAQVLWRHFQEATLAAVVPAGAPSPAAQELLQIRDMALAIAHMAEQQYSLETRVQAVDARLDQAAGVVQDLRQRLRRVERRVDPETVLTEEQAAALSARVRALGMALSAADPRKNHFQGIFGELYRRFRIGDYKHLRQAQFAEAMAFLDEWGAALQHGASAPPALPSGASAPPDAP